MSNHSYENKATEDTERTNRVKITNGRIDRKASKRKVDAALPTHEPGV